MSGYGQHVNPDLTDPQNVREEMGDFYTRNGLEPHTESPRYDEWVTAFTEGEEFMETFGELFDSSETVADERLVPDGGQEYKPDGGYESETLADISHEPPAWTEQDNPSL